MTSTPLTDIQKAFSASISNLFTGVDEAQTQATFKAQIESIGLITTELSSLFVTLSAISKVLVNNPNPEQKVELSKKLTDMVTGGLSFLYSQPGLANLPNDTDITGDAKNAEFFALLKTLKTEVETLVKDPTNALQVITSRVSGAYAQYLTLSKEVSARAVAMKSASSKLIISIH